MEGSTKTFLTKFALYFLFAILLIGLLLSVKSAMAFTWEGELNPDEFDNWELLTIQPTTQGYFWVFIENPDQASPIDVVVMEVDLDSNVLGYRYFRYGEPHVFVYNSFQDKYVEVPLTEGKKQGCMKCHQKSKGYEVKATPLREAAVIY